MFLFSKMMALFWTLAEGMILLYLRWGYLKLTGEKADHRRRIIVWSSLFLLLVLWMMTGEELFKQFISGGDHVRLYRWTLWNFLCTLWVILEGGIMIQVLRIHGRLMSKGGKREGRIPVVTMWTLFFVSIFYHWALWEAALGGGMDLGSLRRCAVFYIRICGLLWIVFEWIVAVVGIKTYLLLKRKVETP